MYLFIYLLSDFGFYNRLIIEAELIEIITLINELSLLNNMSHIINL